MTKIVESKKITDILHHVDDKTLVMLDVDNTLVEWTMSFCISTWYDHTMGRLIKRGLSKREAIDKIAAVIEQTWHLFPVKTVEPETTQVINQLHDKNIITMGLTGRQLTAAKHTETQLDSVDIALTKNTIHHEEVHFDPYTGFTKGVLHVGMEREKGECSLTFFEKIGYQPERVVFVDDMKYYIDSVHNAFGEKEIPCTCIHYGATHEKSKQFDPDKANAELLVKLEDAGFDMKTFKDLL